MTSIRQLPTDDLAGLDLQPLAQLEAGLSDLSARLGIDPERDRDELGALTVAAIAVGPNRYLLRSFDDAPQVATEIHCAEAGDPVEQLRKLLDVVDLHDVLTQWWDGTMWRAEPVDPAA
jgi:hypothetical protein